MLHRGIQAVKSENWFSSPQIPPRGCRHHSFLLCSRSRV